MDTDYAQESTSCGQVANHRASRATAMLAQVNQAQQSVLALLR